MKKFRENEEDNVIKWRATNYLEMIEFMTLIRKKDTLTLYNSISILQITKIKKFYLDLRVITILISLELQASILVHLVALLYFLELSKGVISTISKARVSLESEILLLKTYTLSLV